MRNGIRFAIALGALGALSSGCVRYQVMTAEDHGQLPVTQLETIKTTNYLVFFTQEHQFWLCEDRGESLVCDRRCGGKTDLECPSLSAGWGGISTNVR